MNYQRFSPRQLLTLMWWNDPRFRGRDAIICDGSIRSGKTVSMSVGFALWSMTEFDGEVFAICGKTIESLRRNVITQLPSLLCGIFAVKEHRSENRVTMSGGGHTNTYYLFGGKDEGSAALIQGITLSGILMDEVALMPRSFVEQALARCSKAGSKFWFNCNPERPSHWFYTEWIQKAQTRNVLHLHFTMDDNFSLEPAIRKRYKNMYTGVFYKRFILGEWAATDGLIYQQFVDELDRFLLDAAPEDIQYAVIGVDFGGSKSAHSFTLTGFTRNFQRVVVLDEYYHNNMKSGRHSSKQVEEAFVDFVRRAKMRYKVYEAYCDSAEQTLIEGLTVAAARAHVGIAVRNAIKGPINGRIAFYNSLMAQDRFRVLRSCKAHIKALSDAVYDDKQAVKDVRLDNNTSDIDSLDSMEYTTESIQESILYMGR